MVVIKICLISHKQIAEEFIKTSLLYILVDCLLRKHVLKTLNYVIHRIDNMTAYVVNYTV